jgi:WD40 repeat protein
MMDSVATAVQSAPAASTQFLRHRGPVTCVAAVPHTNLAVSSGYDGAVGLFNLESGAVELLGYHGHLVNRIVVNREGTRAASSSSDYDIYLWDLRARTVERVLRGHSDDVEDFAFVNDGVGVSVSRDQRILIWDLATGAVTRIIEDHEKDVLAVVSDGDSFFTSGDDMTLRQWDLKTGRMLRKWGPFEHETDTCAIDTVLQRAVLGCDDGVIRVFSTSTGELVREIPAHASGIKKVCTSPTSGDILSAAYDQRIRIWDAQTLAPKIELARVVSTWERSLNWSPDGTSVLAGTFDGTVLVWDAATGRLSKHVGDLETVAGNACFNEASATTDGDLAIVSDDGYIRLATLTPTTSAWRNKIEPSSGRVLMNAVTLDAASKRVIAGTHDHRVLIYDWDGAKLSHEKILALGEGPINSIRVAHNPGYDANAFVACYSGAVVHVGPDGEIKNKIRHHEGAVKALRLHPSRPIGASCGADGLLLSWGLDGALLKRFAGHTAIVDDLEISPSGMMVASAGRDFVLKVHSLEDGELLHAIRIGRRSPKSISFVSETMVVIGDYWGTLICVNLENEKVSRVQIARNGISSLSRSGDHLVATSYDGSIYLVRTSDFQVVNTLTAMKQRIE